MYFCENKTDNKQSLQVFYKHNLLGYKQLIIKYLLLNFVINNFQYLLKANEQINVVIDI